MCNMGQAGGNPNRRDVHHEVYGGYMCRKQLRTNSGAQCELLATCTSGNAALLALGTEVGGDGYYLQNPSHFVCM